jgi:hypothetical protein
VSPLGCFRAENASNFTNQQRETGSSTFAPKWQDLYWRLTMTKTPSKTTQKDLEELFSKHQLMPVLREEFREMGEDQVVCEPRMATEALVQMYLHRQCDVPTLVGILSPKYGEPQDVADKLLLLVEIDYFDYDFNKKKFMVKYDVSDDVKEMLAKYQYPLPMVVKPKKVNHNFQTGYLTVKGTVVLNGSDYFDDKDLCLDHLNRANSVALSLNMETALSEQGKYIRPQRNQGEAFDDFRKRQKQSDVFYATSMQVMETLESLSDELYLTHKYDRRGRCYASGYHVNSQGTDYNKAVLELAKKEVIT